jgi:hypothetical protein
LREPFVLTVLTLFMALALAWGLVLPAFESVDEQNHYRYMVFLKDHGRLPRQLPSPAECTGEGHQPPLYYEFGAAALKLGWPQAGFQDPPLRRDFAFDRQPAYFQAPMAGDFAGQNGAVHGLRILQLFFLLLPGVLLLAHLLLRALPGGPGKLAWAVLVLNPAFVGLAGALNNDHAAFALGTLAVASLMAGPVGWLGWSAAGLALGLAGLAKPTALGLGLAGLWCWWRSRPRRAGDLAAYLAAASLVMLPWCLRNEVLYHDWTAFSVIAADCPQCLDPKPWASAHWWAFWLSRSFESFWSLFGWMSWRSPGAVTLCFLGLCAGAGLGWLRPGSSRLDARARGLAWAGVIGVAVVVLRHDMALDPPAGRYFYPALAPLGLLLGGGWSAWPWARRPWAPWLLAGAMAWLDLWLFCCRLIPFYHPS